MRRILSKAKARDSQDSRILSGLRSPYHERILPASGVNGWHPSAAWDHWGEWLQDDARRVYRYLRRAASGERRPFTVDALRRELHLGHDRLRDSLHDLERLGFIKCKWGKLMPVTITVRDVPDVPETVEKQIKHLSTGVKLEVSQSDVNRFLAYWCEKYEQHRKTPYHIVRGRDSKLVHDLLETFGLDELKRLAWYLLRFGVAAEVLPRDMVSIPTFAANINQIATARKQAVADEMRQK